MVTVGIIPARYDASRLPGKVLKKIGGKPLIQLVYESARKARRLDDLLVATDDRRVEDAVTQFGGKAVLTSPSHRSGSDRLAEAASPIECDIVVNIQGDEPLIRGESIDAAVGALMDYKRLEVVTLATPLGDDREAGDPNMVKVVTDLEGNALYFSRTRIPYIRDAIAGKARFLKHIGLYAFRKDLLIRFTNWPQTELEKLEKLEQLRILEHGVKIRVVITPYDSLGVDTPEDLERVRKLFETK